MRTELLRPDGVTPVVTLKVVWLCEGSRLRGRRGAFANDQRLVPLRGDAEAKCPRVLNELNDYTIGQPCIDRHNRYRQFILAMEKRLVTNSQKNTQTDI